MNACIDFGNTEGKIGLFQNSKLLEIIPISVSSEVIGILQSKQVKNIIICNVGKEQDSFVQELEMYFSVFQLTHETPTPIINNYASPKTLGMDRLAGIVGVKSLFPNEASLVIDLGTCITYDFVSEDSRYSGGIISPGMRMRAKAMSEFTASLPMVENFDSTDLVGDSTQAALQSGVVNGVKHELESTINAYKDRFGIFNTVFCGGDAVFFESQLKAHIFVRKEIVMLGLDRILTELTTNKTT
ncbi:MAG: type III pantothenate kinase [Arenicella sp.]|jgi:type III pantothenate kinase